MDERPVGMFDSGVGGLSVYRHFRSLAPTENVIYFADTEYFPYGDRPVPEVRKRAFAITRRLIQSNAKLIVVACNTASAAAVAELREAFPFVPFVAMVPGLKPAVASSAARHVVILATPGTMDGELYRRVREEFGEGARIEQAVSHDLAGIVERGEAGSTHAADALRAALRPAIEAGADTAVLGCTHYEFLRDDIAALFPDLAVIQTSEAVARRAVDVLATEGLARGGTEPGWLNVIVTGDRDAFYERMASLGFPRKEAVAS